MSEEMAPILTEAAGGRQVSLSLTDDGLRIFERLGTQWLAAVVRAISTTYPDEMIELVLRADASEPMEPAQAIHPGLPGDTFTREGGIGLLTIEGDSSHLMIARRVSVPSLELLDGASSFGFVDGRQGLRRKIGQVYGEIYRRAPFALDRFKQYRNSRHDWRAGTAARGASSMVRVTPTTTTVSDQPAAAWFALHWLEAGGAEAWALESAALARACGLEVVITVDRAAPQRWLDRALAITPHVYLGANVMEPRDWSRFGRKILAQHRVVLLHVHHSAMAYQLLPRLRHLQPGLRVIDSTHIAEHRTGGFVRQSLEHSELIDVHHVISPVLRDTYVLESAVPTERVIYRPLTGLDGQQVGAAATSAARDMAQPLRVGFLGRLAPQKRPFLFVALAKRLHRALPDRFRFVMQGSGPLEDLVGRNLAKAKLTGIVERRDWGPVADFFDAIDVLAITSDNEGLTLTALEADGHGVLVLSADVGSQRTVVTSETLVPREPDAFLRAAAPTLRRLADEPGYFDALLAKQRDLHQQIRALEPASVYMRRYYSALTKES